MYTSDLKLVHKRLSSASINDIFVSFLLSTFFLHFRFFSFHRQEIRSLSSDVIKRYIMQVDDIPPPMCRPVTGYAAISIGTSKVI